MKNIKFPLALVILVIVAMVFGLITFVGQNFLTGGDTGKSTITTIAYTAGLALLALIPRWLKQASSNYKTYIILEICSLVLFVGGTVFLARPFVHYFGVSADRARIQQSMETVLSESEEMYERYEKYADNRLRLYRNGLATAINQNRSGISTKDYEMYGFTPGTSDTVQANEKEKILRENLYNSSYKTNKENNLKWLNATREALENWNPVKVSAITGKLGPAVTAWYNSLVDGSRFRAKGEEAEDFHYGLSLNSLNDLLTARRNPSIIGLLLAVVVALLMLLPYLSASRSAGWPGWDVLLGKVGGNNF